MLIMMRIRNLVRGLGCPLSLLMPPPFKYMIITNTTVAISINISIVIIDNNIIDCSTLAWSVGQGSSPGTSFYWKRDQNQK